MTPAPPIGHPPHRAPTPPQTRPLAPLASAPLGDHLRGATVVRVWRPVVDDAGKLSEIRTHTLVGPVAVRVAIAAIGPDQRLTELECGRCTPRTRAAFETAAGLQVAAIELGCPGQPSGTARLVRGAPPQCANVRISDSKALTRALADTGAGANVAPAVMP